MLIHFQADREDVPYFYNYCGHTTYILVNIHLEKVVYRIPCRVRIQLTTSAGARCFPATHNVQKLKYNVDYFSPLNSSSTHNDLLRLTGIIVLME